MLKRECFNFTKALNRRLFRSLFREVFLFSAIFDGTPMLRYLLCLKAHPIKFGQSYKNSIVGQLNGHTPRNQSGFATPLPTQGSSPFTRFPWNPELKKLVDRIELYSVVHLRVSRRLVPCRSVPLRKISKIPTRTKRDFVTSDTISNGRQVTRRRYIQFHLPLLADDIANCEWPMIWDCPED